MTITTCSPRELAACTALYEAAFPPEERRPTAAWQALVKGGDTRFEALAIADAKGDPAGFITTWTLPSARYVEHFAIHSGLRGGGLGGRAFASLREKATTSLPLVLEVEAPVDELTRRRIAFYERHGMHLLRDTTYEQPPYVAGGKALPMCLMASLTEHELGAERIGRIVRDIYEAVYGV